MDLAGRIVGDRYRLDALLATGGMGQVWRAVDVVLRRPVAVKVLQKRDPAALARFRAEAQLAAGLAEVTDGRLFLTVFPQTQTPRAQLEALEAKREEERRKDRERKATQRAVAAERTDRRTQQDQDQEQAQLQEQTPLVDDHPLSGRGEPTQPREGPCDDPAHYGCGNERWCCVHCLAESGFIEHPDAELADDDLARVKVRYRQRARELARAGVVMGRLDRCGEPVDDRDDHDPRCVNRWLPETPDGRAVACTRCQPLLAYRRDHLARILGRPTP